MRAGLMLYFRCGAGDGTHDKKRRSGSQRKNISANRRSKGETPMTANGSGSRIRVFDESGEWIGTTYPKRARGLVKNGRAR